MLLPASTTAPRISPRLRLRVEDPTVQAPPGEASKTERSAFTREAPPMSPALGTAALDAQTPRSSVVEALIDRAGAAVERTVMSATIPW